MKRNRKRNARKSLGRKISKNAVRLPRAFRIVPVEVKGSVSKHEHIVGQAALPPCPNDCVFAAKISVGGLDYCVYVCPEGDLFFIRC